MTTDEHISDDLAIVARTSRARPIALETTLAKVTASERKPAPPVGFATTYVYATRIARVSAGIAAVLSIAALLVFVHFGHDEDNEGILDSLAHMSKLWVALCVLGVAAMTHMVTSRIAINARNPDLRRAGTWSVAVSIVGMMAFCLFFGMMQAVLGGEGVVNIASGRVWAIGANVMLLSAIVGATVGAVGVARAGLTTKRWMLPAGLILLVATISMGRAFDIGPMQGGVQYVPSMPLRAVLTSTGTIALFLIVTSIVLAIHRRDDQYSS